MNATPSTWFIQGNGNTPLGPYTSEQLIDSWRTKRLNPSVLCWQEGMASWQPVAAVEPFFSTMRAERKAARRRTLRLLGIIVLVILVFGAIAGIGYFWWTESTTIAQAKQLIAAERYDEASRLLEPFAKESYFFRRRADYLLALGLARQYASASRGEDVGDDLLVDAKKRFEELFAASPKWQEEAGTDLAGIIGIVPSQASDSLDRSFRLASLLSTTQLADRKQLVKELLGKATGIWSNQERGPEQTQGNIVAWIVGDDAAIMDDILAAILSDTSNVEANLDQKLACIQHWGRSKATLASLLKAGLVKRADGIVGAAALEKRHRLIATAKRIDPQFDTWRYWERHFQNADSQNAQDAVAILTFMVEGERNAERIKDATDMYGDLRKRYPDTAMTPPPEIRDAADAAHLHELIANAEQLVKNKQYRDARMKLDDAHRRFSTVWNRDADAVRLDKEVDFHLHFENALRSYGNGDFAAALTEVSSALDIRPEDKEALELRNKVQIAADKAEVEQHRRKAESVIAEGDFRLAIGEILKAREILERPSNAEWISSSRRVLDELAKTLIAKVIEQATELSDKRQYRKAETVVALGRRLSPSDAGLSELAEKITTLKSDPKTANISGTWQCSENGDVNEMTLTDTGSDSVAWKSRRGQQDTGTFTRKGAALEGTRPFEMRGVDGELAVRVRIEIPDTLVVCSMVFTPTGKKMAPQRDNTKHTWTKVKGDTNDAEANEETDESGDHSSNRHTSPHEAQKPKKTPHHPLAPQLPVPRRW